jgi:hypothetical protein
MILSSGAVAAKPRPKSSALCSKAPPPKSFCDFGGGWEGVVLPGGGLFRAWGCREGFFQNAIRGYASYLDKTEHMI